MSTHLAREYADMMTGLANSGPPMVPSLEPLTPADFDAVEKHIRRFALLADDYVRALAETVYGVPLREVQYGSHFEHPVSDALCDLIADARKCATCRVEVEPAPADDYWLQRSHEEAA